MDDFQMHVRGDDKRMLDLSLRLVLCQTPGAKFAGFAERVIEGQTPSLLLYWHINPKDQAREGSQKFLTPLGDEAALEQCWAWLQEHKPAADAVPDIDGDVGRGFALYAGYALREGLRLKSGDARSAYLSAVIRPIWVEYHK